jgi:hypothetical protein
MVIRQSNRAVFPLPAEKHLPGRLSRRERSSMTRAAALASDA